jgi:ribosome maturation factor RimP
MLNRTEIENKIEKWLEPLLEERGLTLVDLELTGAGPRMILRVFIDKEEGVTLEDCKDLSEELSLILDVEDPIPGPYILEVSSPGLTRNLKKEREFRWAVGKKVRVVSKKGEFTGILVDYTGSSFILKSGDSLVEVPKGDILKIQLNEMGEKR